MDFSAQYIVSILFFSELLAHVFLFCLLLHFLDLLYIFLFLFLLYVFLLFITIHISSIIVGLNLFDLLRFNLNLNLNSLWFCCFIFYSCLSGFYLCNRFLRILLKLKVGHFILYDLFLEILVFNGIDILLYPFFILSQLINLLLGYCCLFFIKFEVIILLGIINDYVLFINLYLLQLSSELSNIVDS